MEYLAFLLAIVALIWVLKNGTRVDELEETQLRLQREHARLRNDLEALRKTPAPADTAPKREEVKAQPPVESAPASAPPIPIEKPIETPAAPKQPEPVVAQVPPRIPPP